MKIANLNIMFLLRTALIILLFLNAHSSFGNNFSKENTELVKAWETAIGRPLLRKDVPFLTKLSEILEQSVLNKLPNGQTDLDAIVAAIKHPCCGTTHPFMKNVADHLDDIKHVLNNFDGVPGFDKVVALTKRYKGKGGEKIFKEAAGEFRKQEGSWFAMKKMDGLDPTKVKTIDATFEGLPDDICDNCRFDVLMTDGTKMEYKSWGKVGVDFIASRKPGSSFYKQLMSYFSDASSVNLSKIEYHFDPAKLIADGVANPETYIKGKFKTFFENNKPEVFEVMNDNLKLSLQIDDVADLTSSKIDEIINVIIIVQ